MSWLAVYAAIVGTLAVLLQALRTYWQWRERRAWNAVASGHLVGTRPESGRPVCPGGSQCGRDLTSRSAED